MDERALEEAAKAFAEIRGGCVTHTDRLRAAIARYEECQWRPMEEAPRDGRQILLRRGERVTAGAWYEWTETCAEYSSRGDYIGQSVQDGGAEWVTWDGGFTDEEPPTAWQPLPAPPAKGDEHEG